MSDAAAPRRSRYASWPSLALGIFFGLFYAYDLWEAVGSLLTLAGVSAQFGVALSPLAWVVLGLSVLLPIGLFVGALLLGRGRGILVQAFLYVLGLSLSAATYLSLVAASAFA